MKERKKGRKEGKKEGKEREKVMELELIKALDSDQNLVPSSLLSPLSPLRRSLLASPKSSSKAFSQVRSIRKNRR
ncbi:hypothetical protein H671_8g19408 [Cricetulus griseus]|uniref:Uncharacterized protein n=1 Tax=Cricetulus griseus TaxID=10029 RepID=A0A061I279_CRIGR|nr:hypothetical protein H671_8g19408 [Cricetulus griseus]